MGSVKNAANEGSCIAKNNWINSAVVPFFFLPWPPFFKHILKTKIGVIGIKSLDLNSLNSQYLFLREFLQISQFVFKFSEITLQQPLINGIKNCVDTTHKKLASILLGKERN